MLNYQRLIIRRTDVHGGPQWKRQDYAGRMYILSNCTPLLVKFLQGQHDNFVNGEGLVNGEWMVNGKWMNFRPQLQECDTTHNQSNVF